MAAAPSEGSPDNDRATVLVVDDEPDLVELLQYALETEGFTVLTASDGVAGLAIAEAEKPDLIVVDIMMPRMDGIALTAQIRERAALRLTPILMLTARTDERDEIAGLEAGADDYLPKPVSPKRLVSRVKALLRRVEREEEATTAQVRVHDLVIDRDRYLVERPASGETFRLPRKEFELLFFLASHPGRVFERDELLSAVWGADVVVVDRTVDVHVRKIREKIGSDYIETVKGVGYRLAEALEG
ncbi:DNA-binding response regulator [Rubrivirga sp. SAORIC476]|uniref:response regulator transcription factor n=1 Tax=Rubrivirga sp. SAORIC476 TaxID=1961794 RepID=UPI000BA994DB|nr:response regulator transcription factor [Rubrivirga sp. SAORIC476]MAQ95856.1 DNA-binding response regulator [Rhodothermaceae bacterium]MBC12632.1 DNA-binding response regulator [Rhodothermaceae bacterium]PAP81708.1 DNA-binding response regulator [Rubrivirga sp. SAORIC476]